MQKRLARDLEKRNPEFIFGSIEIPFHELTDMTFIASGGYGKVHSAKYRGEKVAVKMLNVEVLSPSAIVQFREGLKHMMHFDPCTL